MKIDIKELKEAIIYNKTILFDSNSVDYEFYYNDFVIRVVKMNVYHTNKTMKLHHIYIKRHNYDVELNWSYDKFMHDMNYTECEKELQKLFEVKQSRYLIIITDPKRGFPIQLSIRKMKDHETKKDICFNKGNYNNKNQYVIHDSWDKVLREIEKYNRLAERRLKPLFVLNMTSDYIPNIANVTNFTCSEDKPIF